MLRRDVIHRDHESQIDHQYLKNACARNEVYEST